MKSSFSNRSIKLKASQVPKHSTVVYNNSQLTGKLLTSAKMLFLSRMDGKESSRNSPYKVINQDCFHVCDWPTQYIDS